jgi:YkoY family integral membrane protein
VIALAFLELLLSADNALVMAIIARALPEKRRARALFIGVISAFILRLAAIVGLAYLIQFFWIQLLGGIYLIYLCISNLKKKRIDITPRVRDFWKVVILIEFFDLAFAIDSIVAGIAFVAPDIPAKLWIVYVGGMIGLLGTRMAAHYFTILIAKFPRLERQAFLIVGWIGLKLALTTLGVTFPGIIFWGVMLLLFILGFV